MITAWLQVSAPEHIAARGIHRLIGRIGTTLAAGVLCALGPDVANATDPEVEWRVASWLSVDNGDGTYTAPVILKATNTGKDDLANVQIENPLDIFGSGSVISVSRPDVEQGVAAINPDFDGLIDARVLKGTDTLARGAVLKLRFEVTYDANGQTGPFWNRASFHATGKLSGKDVQESGVVRIRVPANPGARWEKTAGDVVDNDDGSYSVPITLEATNTGDERLVDLQIKDDLDIFGNRDGVSVTPPEVLLGDLALNPGYDGIDDIRLLQGTDLLDPGDTIRLRFTVTFEPGDEPGPFTNQALFWSEGKYSGMEVDIYASAEIVLPPAPGIMLAQTAGTIVRDDNGDLRVPIELTLTNNGEEDLEDLQVRDDLVAFLGTDLIDPEDIVAPGLTLNPDFDGENNIELLGDGNELAKDAAATITFMVRFDAGIVPGTYVNAANATGIGVESGRAVSDSAEASIVVDAPPLPPPPLPPPPIIVTKEADKPEVVRGEIFGYDVTLVNQSDEVIEDIAITDRPPVGFDVVADSALIIRAGPDGVLHTPDDDSNPIVFDGTTTIEFVVFDLAPREALVIRYLMRVGTGIVDGEHTNTVVVTPDLFVPVKAEAPVSVVGDPMFEQSTIVGRVFDDRNRNGKYDKGDKGIAGVRIGTVSGLMIETDAEGRYHVADVGVARFERGANFIIKVDESTLPEESEDLEDNPRVVRLTQGMMSRVNFAVNVRNENVPNCSRICVDITPRHARPDLDPVYFESGRSDIPQDYAIGIVKLLEAFRKEQNARLIFVGHTDAEPVGGELADLLGASGETGNLILSKRRAREVCEFVRDRLGIWSDCSLVQGRGSSEPAILGEDDALSWRHRRVEIEVEYFDLDWSAPQPVLLPEVCVDVSREDALTDILSRQPRIEATENSCFTYAEPGPPTLSAEAREIKVSGGRFGCNRLAADVLWGRNPRETEQGRSSVTVHASELGDSQMDGYACREGIVAGEYPIDVRTEMGSVLWINKAGDVIRQREPSNAEQIVVTPFRDETDVTVISAVRIANEGTEPTEDPGTRIVLPVPDALQLYHTDDALGIEPRLDVLALNPAIRPDTGNLRTVNFVGYTNYAAFIESYTMDIYGVRDGGHQREWIRTLPEEGVATKMGIEDRFRFTYSADDIAPYSALEYVLRVSGCVESFVHSECYIDETGPRRLPIQGEYPGDDAIRDAPEIWGKSNLARQSIPIGGARIRTSGIANGDETLIEVGDVMVPVGDQHRFVLEEHQPFFSNAPGSTPNVANPPQAPEFITADATDIKVRGGLFGCGVEVGADLRGRTNSFDPIDMSLTVAADATATALLDVECDDGRIAGEYPIIVSTQEGTEILISKAGDVFRSEYPETGMNAQHIVVTPFRDYTDNSVVSAMRISNEGVRILKQAGPSWPPQPWPPPSDADYEFTVALANLTVGQNNLSGNRDYLSGDEHFDGSTFTDGRLAVYTKRRISESLMFTAQLDTTEDELRNLSDNLKRRDPRRLFRQLDPNRHYAVYGDDSTTITDVDTQGAFYLRADWDGNTALWGNFNTGITGTELAQYNRSLYGASFRHVNQKTTSNGDAETRLTAFVSEAQSAAAHVTFQATGGSLYYLRHTDIVQGSEKVWIEVRRRDSELVVEREELIVGRDYEVDAIQGRIILSRPLSQIVNDRNSTIIRSSPLDGDQVFLLADYEYVPASFEAEDLTFGARGQAWIGDSFGVGATAVADERGGEDYNMEGIDLAYKHDDGSCDDDTEHCRHDEGSWVRAEFAQSSARQQGSNYVSRDGGLSFDPQASADAGIEGQAFALEGRLDVGGIGDVRAWHKMREAGFSTGRLGQGIDVNDSGVETRLRLTEEIEVSASFTDLERERQSRERVSRVQADADYDRWSFGVELRQEDIDVFDPMPFTPVAGMVTGGNGGDALLLGGRVGYTFDDGTTAYAAAQTVSNRSGDYRDNELVSVGVNSRLQNDTSVSLEVSDGDRGSALIGGFDVTTAAGLDFNLSGGIGSGATTQFGTRYAIADGHELYGSYTVDPDRTEGERNLLTLGQRRAFGNEMSIFAESQFGKDDTYANISHVFGLKFDGIKAWRFSGSMQFGENNRLGHNLERRALSLGASRRTDKLRIASRVELREDEGAGVHSKQYVSINSFTHLAAENWRWLGQLNVSWTDDELNGGRDARFVEFEIGHAYRPVTMGELNEWNVLTKYSYLYDLPTEGQATVRPDEKSHLLAIDGLYELSESWELGGKIAFRKGERRAIRQSGPWYEFGLRMVAVRARYRLPGEVDGLAEYRWLSDIDGDNTRHGALLAAYKYVGDNFKLGVGYNFTDFDDELRADGYRNHGWFLDLVGMY